MPRPLPPPAAAPAADRAPWRWIWLGVAGLTAVRVLCLCLSPLELYPDEAQYWAWSRHLDWGYFSKPPMIAWLIAATTALFGEGEAAVRLSAPLLHGAAALAVAAAAARLYGGRTTPWAAAIYALMPGVLLSCTVIATDAPLLCALAFALWAYAALWTRPSRGVALALGSAVGAACLAKYAGLYLVVGAALHAAVDARARRMWSGGRAALAVAALLACLAPNLLWNAGHHFQTLAHTAADADWRTPAEQARRRAGGFDPRGPAGFLFGQFGVFGPVPLAALIAGGGWLIVRRRAPSGPDRLLLCLIAPPLAVVFAEAVVARANANWAAAAYVPGAVLAAAWLGRSRGARRWRAAGLALQAALAVVVAAGVIDPALADAAGLGGALKRARGWRETAARVDGYVRGLQRAGPVSAVAVDDRFLFNALTYYGRGGLGAPARPLRMWVHEARPMNQAEAEHPLTPAEGARVAFVSEPFTAEAQADFARMGAVRVETLPLAHGHARRIALFEGWGFRPRPRPPASR